jgi:hypothetical protein
MRRTTLNQSQVSQKRLDLGPRAESSQNRAGFCQLLVTELQAVKGFVGNQVTDRINYQD